VTDAAANAERWALILYINGASTESIRAIEAVRRLCDEELGGQVELEVVDVHGQPALGLPDQIVAVPTLVKRFPQPPRRIVGDLSDPGRLRRWLELDPVAGGGHPGQEA
jgi:circadian clock protein KaiB